MHISLKSMKIIYWLVTLSFFLSIMLLSQLRPETYTWRVATLQIMCFTVAVGLYFYVFKQFHKTIVAASSAYEPRFNSRIKNQLWGLLLRTVSGAIGLGFVALILPLSYDNILFTLVVYTAVMIVGFLNDGKHYDEFHI